MEKIKQLQSMIEKSKSIVFFGGAGVSTESGIPDFRSAHGLYSQKSETGFSYEEMLSHSYFTRHTEDFYKFYKTTMLYPNATPNKAHLALAELEKRGKLKAVITQNIDRLHQKAGSKNVLELHGNVFDNYCVRCGKHYSLDYITHSDGVPFCSCGGTVRPGIVLYEEQLPERVLDRAVAYTASAELLIVGGTSLSVYPAAGLIQYLNGSLVIINKSTTPYDNAADLTIDASIGEALEYCIHK